ncbi:MAG: alpha/beta fold hydrolase [Gammaproteobacteria bacterium]|nr:alpha/beta fold hydrolase [Gammaproteobacteria bacterium]MDH3859026.1 alpha/beta fold hydrolase [Gammaproteobacteria bacterium]
MTHEHGYRAPRHLRNAHLQTVLNSQGPRKLRARYLSKRLESEKLILQADDGTRLLAEFDRAANGCSVLVILLHGWEGCSRSSYMVTTAASLLAQGFDVLRVNLRDHGDSHHLNRELFNSTRSPEVASALLEFVDNHTYDHVFLAGFSLGASFALRIAADSGSGIGLDASIAVCPPTDPARAMDALNNGFFAYERYFFRRWYRSLQYKLQHFPDLDYGAELVTAKSLDDLNRIFIPRHTVYSNVDDYFAAYALVGDRLSAMAMPAYLIAAEDDPIIPVDDLKRIDPVENLQVETYRHGGHCGFIENLAAHSWVEGRIIQIIQAQLSKVGFRKTG